MARHQEISPYLRRPIRQDWQAVWLEQETRKLDEAEKEKSNATLPRNSDR